MRSLADAVGAAAMAAALTAAVLAGCARKAPPAPPIVYPYSSTAPKVFYATGAGLAESAPVAGAEAAEGVLASRAPNASVLSSDGKVLLAALNGYGAVRIETSPAGGSYRLLPTKVDSFAGLSTAGAWPAAGGFLVQLFRDPFASAMAGKGSGVPLTTEAGGEPAAARLAFFGPDGAPSAPELFAAEAGEGFELFALLPARGRWYAELRRETTARAELRFFELEAPPSWGASTVVDSASFLDAPTADGAEQGPAAARAAAPIARSDFEASLRPRPLSSLAGPSGEALRAALAALGPGPWLARLKSAAGGDDWFLSSGAPEDAESAYAWANGDEVAALAMDGSLAVSAGGQAARRASLATGAALPEETAFTTLAAAGGLVAAAWEAGEFPTLSQAGLVIAALPR
jgi:hypothetical protein